MSAEPSAIANPSGGEALPAFEARFPRRQRIRNVLDDPEVWACGEAVPVPPRHLGGASRHYPGWMWVVFDTLVHDFGSAVEVAREMTDPDYWGMLQRAAKARYPEDESKWLSDKPMKLHHFNYAKKRYLKAPDYLDAIGDIHRHHAASLAQDVGLCTPEEKGASWTHPKLENVVYGDGKVVTARTKKPRVDPKTGEVHPRCEPDLEPYVTGGGEWCEGVGFVFLSARGRNANHRVILDVIDAPRRGGEAAHAMAAFRRTLPLLPDSQAGLYDGAWRGTHRAEIYELGKLPISPPRNRGNPKPKERHYGPAIVRRPDGSEAIIEVHLRDFLPHIKEVADDGSPLLTPLLRIKTSKPAPKTGRCYNEYRVPLDHGGGTVRLRLTSDEADRVNGFNREEYLSAFPAGDSDYDRIYKRRNDAESGNNTLDNSMLRERAHSIGRAGIRLNMITWALYKNAQTRALYASRAGPALAAAA